MDGHLLDEAVKNLFNMCMECRRLNRKAYSSR